MNKQNKSWYYDDTIILALAFLVLMVSYAVGVSVFIAKGDDRTVGAFEAVTGISGVVLYFGTVFYVIRAYKAQREQIRIQNIQIEIQQKEIEQNKEDVEFSRVLDVVYRQLQFTRDYHTKREKHNKGINNATDRLLESLRIMNILSSERYINLVSL